MKTIRTRIAPSPTGEDFHIGNAYTALINYVFAKKHGGQFIIRVEDTDQARLVEGSEDRILVSLKWLGITYDEGPDIGGPFAPYRQSERLALYKKYAEELVAVGHAYYCFCTPQRLEQMRQDQEARHEPPMYDGMCRNLKSQITMTKLKQGVKHVIRLKVPRDGETTFADLIRGEISFENKLIDDQVILKSDGFPTYHLGVVVDDHLMEISHIIRGEEWISSTPKHIFLYQFFGWELPVFAHLPLLRNPDKSKLSKRRNPVWVSWYREQGYLPEAILNYLATMAWAHPEGKEKFTVEEMIKVFDLTKIQTTAPIFNTEKLCWLNGEYIRSMKDNELLESLKDYSDRYQNRNQGKFVHTAACQNFPLMVRSIIPLVKERMKTLGEFWSLAGFFFERPKEIERPLKQELVALAKKALEGSEWNHAAMEVAIRKAAEEAGVKAKDLFMELRVSVTGKTVGPPLLESLEILGKEEALARLTRE